MSAVIRWNMADVSVEDLNLFQDDWRFDDYGIADAARAEVLRRGRMAIARHQGDVVMADMVRFITE